MKNAMHDIHAQRLWVLEAGWLLLALIVPLWINLWAAQPFDPAKISLMRGLVWFLTAVWLADWLLSRRPFREELPPRTLLLPILALGSSAILSTLTANDPPLSLWGSYERAYGLLTLISYLLLAVVLAARLRDLTQAGRLLTMIVGSSVPILLLSGLQAAGYSPLPLVTDARSPVFATLGRANFVGAYLAILLPLTLFLAWRAPGRVGRLGYLALAAAQVCVIGLTLARAAWVAAAAGLVLLFAGWAWLYLAPRRRRWLEAGLATLIVAGAALAAIGLLRADAGSLAARRTIWGAVIGLIGERPLLGHGLDSLGLTFMRVFPPQLVYYQGREVFVDRAHNWPLDTAFSLGLIGLLATVWLWGAALWFGWRAVRRCHSLGQRERAALLLACGAGCGANLAGNLFSFDVAPTALTSFTLLGLIAALGRERVPVEASPAPRWRYGLAGGLVILALAAGWWGNGRFLLADVAQQRSLDAMGRGDLRQALTATGQSVALWPQEPAYWKQLALVYGAQGQLDKAGAAWHEALMRRPANPALWADMGQFYTFVAGQYGVETLPQAESAFAQAAALAPNHARLQLAWGEMYLFAGEWAAAKGRFERAVELDTTDWLAWGLLAEAYARLGQAALAQTAQMEAEYWHSRSTEFLGLDLRPRP